LALTTALFGQLRSAILFACHFVCDPTFCEDNCADEAVDQKKILSASTFCLLLMGWSSIAQAAYSPGDQILFMLKWALYSTAMCSVLMVCKVPVVIMLENYLT
jgi:hypothetical protein